MFTSISMTVIFPFLMLWIAVLCIVFIQYKLAASATSLSVIFAFLVGLITIQALVPLALVTVTTICAVLFHRSNKHLFWIFLLLTAITCYGLGTHAFNGFNNPLIVDGAILTSISTPYTLYWNYDKACAAVVLLFLYQSLCGHNPLSTTHLKTAIVALLGTLAVTLTLAYLLGLVRWEPKVPEFFLFWTLSNLFITAAAEEGFFRGLVQFQLHQTLYPVIKYAGVLSITIAGTLFGVAHFAMGSSYVLAAIAAGIGYGVVFHITRRLEASILTHYLLNTIHILLFTYPMVKSVH